MILLSSSLDYKNSSPNLDIMHQEKRLTPKDRGLAAIKNKVEKQRAGTEAEDVGAGSRSSFLHFFFKREMNLRISSYLCRRCRYKNQTR